MGYFTLLFIALLASGYALESNELEDTATTGKSAMLKPFFSNIFPLVFPAN